MEWLLEHFVRDGRVQQRWTNDFKKHSIVLKVKSDLSAIVKPNVKMIKTPEADKVIQEEFRAEESIYNGPFTKTALFLLPMLGLNLRNAQFKKFFKNAYLDDVDYDHDYTRPIFVLLSVKDFSDKDYKEVIKFLWAIPGFKMDYDLGRQDDKNLVMLVFETAEKWKEDYYHFKAGRYFKFSKEYKILFPQKTANGPGKPETESLMWGVIHKSAYRKDLIAKHFAPKNDKGEIINLKELDEFRKEMDTWEEIYDRAHKKHELFNYRD